jgi:hypothetical protein
MVNNQGEYVFPTITALYQGLENDFKSTDDKEEALEKLATTKQGNRKNNTVLIKYYQRSLDPDILTAVWNNNPRPQTIGQWMFVAQEKANQLKELHTTSQEIHHAH